ncbi:aldo/keto reductase [Catenuloplanes japonicus]|uniref:aldo/keto reductase n=1 Tax=Catenuloplanes japonicus TaxID=33876 RepID=UPI0005240A3D|nr:aldo/keto reductase [Catenuloplanes japonicus]
MTWQLGDRTVGRVGFGSMRITRDPDTEAAKALLRQAVELGVDHIDTAAFYFSPGGVIGGGSGPVRYATELIRDALSPYPRSLLVATKVGPGIDADGRWVTAATPRHLRAQVEENLRRLGVERLDLVNLRLTGLGREESAAQFAALAAMRDEGLIGQLGLSNARIAHLDDASAIAPVVCVQNSYALDLRRNDDMLRVCGERGIAFVPFFALAGPGRESGAQIQSDPTVRRIARDHGATPQQIRLAWTLHQGPHVLAIPGTGSDVHLRENMAAAGIRLTADDLAQLG